MKYHLRTQALWGLAILWAVGIGIGQLSNLPNIREQVASGLQAGLEDIADEIAEELSARYESQLKTNLGLLVPESSVSLSEWRELSEVWKDRGPDNSPYDFSEAQAIALPDSEMFNWQIHEWNHMNQTWLYKGSMSQAIQKKLPLLYDHWAGQAEAYWQTTVDSTLLLYHQENPFAPPKEYACHPVFEESSGKLMGFVCIQIADQAQTQFLSRYFEEFFSETYPPRKDGIHRSFLNIRIRNDQGELLYQSSLLAGGRIEARASIGKFSSYLGLLEVELGFLGNDSERVAASLHQKNVWLVVGVFAILLLLMGLMFRMFRQSQKLNQLKSDFLANISHELKTPLAAIRLANDSIRHGRYLSQEQLQQTTEIIQAEQNKLHRLLSTLLDFAQMDAGKSMYQKKDIEIESLWHEWLEYAENKTKVLGFELRGEMLNSSRKILADPAAIKDVWDILLDNAIKYSGESRMIMIYTSVTHAEWRVQLEDFGIGIAKENQHIIFDKFVRLTVAETHDVKGYGLGLSIAKSIIQAHRGSISVESTPGQGSRFSVSLPFIQES